MYKRNYMQATEMADRIAKGEVAAQKASARKQEQAGIMARLSERKYEESDTESPLSLATNYISMLRERIQGEEPIVEEGIDTQALSEEVPSSGQQRPQGRYEVPKGEVQDVIYQGLIERGLPKHIAQGFLMNFQDESGFKPSVEEYETNVHGTRGKGLYQLTGSRREQFEEMFGNDYSIPNQLDFLMFELKNTEKGAFEEILSAKTAGEAGAAIVKEFLRPAKEHEKSRVKKYLNSAGYGG